MRCPNGFVQKPPKSGNCVKKTVKKTPSPVPSPVKKTPSPVKKTVKRCPRGTSKNKKTGECVKEVKSKEISPDKKMSPEDDDVVRFRLVRKQGIVLREVCPQDVKKLFHKMDKTNLSSIKYKNVKKC